MKTQFLNSLLFIFIFTFLFSRFNPVLSQTAGTLTFTYSQAAPSSSATKNVMAVWIENSAGSFVKTKMRFWGNSTTDHLPSWVAKSAQNLTDATSGATRTATTSPTAFGAKTINWDGTTTSLALAADGNYNIFVESSYCNPEPSNGQHWIITNFAFTKGASAVHLTPTGPANFSGITLDWVPAAQITVTTSALASTTICSGSTVSIPFTCGTGNVYNNNIWTAQLSDASGSFATPLTIGTLNGIAVGAISATIPSGTAAGTAYRIRVVGSQPSCIGTDNGSNISIINAPLAPTVSTITQPNCTTPTGSVVLNGLPASGSWTINPGNISGTGTTTTINGLAPGTINYTVSSGCTSPASANVVINAHATTPATPVISLNGNVLHSNATTGNQWYDQNGLLSGAINQNYTPTSNGNYYDIVTINGCSSDTSNQIAITSVGIESLNNDKTINVYPNPVSNELIIETKGYINSGFVILNAIGKTVYKGILSEKNSIQTAAFAPGVYILKLENGKIFEFKKIIKE
ncbi:MAG: DUF2271 domain-containing protein [Bacteroidales bacterium]